MKWTPFFLSLLLSAGGSQAQTWKTTVVPKEAKDFQGSSFHTTVPYGFDNLLFQQFCDASEVDLKSPKVILGLAFRAESWATGTLQGKTMVTRVALSTVKASIKQFGTNPKKNRGADYQVCFKRQTIHLPTVKFPVFPEKPLIIHKFDRPFVYKGGSLLIELKNYQKTSPKLKNYAVDRMFGSPSGGLTGWFGHSCPHRKNFISISINSLKIGGSFTIRTFDLSCSTKTGMGINLIGLRADKFGNTSLPLSLGFMGAKGCSLLVSPELFQLGKAGTYNKKPAFIATWPIPNNQALVGAKFYSQWILVETKPAVKIGTSGGANFIVGPSSGGIPIQCGYRYYKGKADPDTDPTLNSIGLNRALVVYLYHS